VVRKIWYDVRQFMPVSVDLDVRPAVCARCDAAVLAFGLRREVTTVKRSVSGRCGRAFGCENSSVRASSRLPCVLRRLACARCHVWRDVRCSRQALPERAKSRRQLANEQRVLWLPDCV